MKIVGWLALGVVAGFALHAWIAPASESSCCKRVAFGARDKIAGKAGAAGDVVSTLLDITGLTDALPGLLDKAGVPADA